jgi:hypothetical protein
MFSSNVSFSYKLLSFFLLNSRSFCSFHIVKLVAWDKSLIANLIAWKKCASQRTVVVSTIL